MITSIHTLIYSDDANATRAFLRDVLGWKCVAEEFDKDWLIFKSGPSELGVHPTHSEWEGKAYDFPRHHAISLMCDDIDSTVGELRAKVVLWLVNCFFIEVIHRRFRPVLGTLVAEPMTRGRVGFWCAHRRCMGSGSGLFSRGF